MEMGSREFWPVQMLVALFMTEALAEACEYAWT